jgi:hypothetical protein
MAKFTITDLNRSELDTCLSVLDGRSIASVAELTLVEPAAGLTPVAPTTETTLAPSVDSSGLLYDERIHSNGGVTKRLKQDGTWRKKSGVSDEFITEVEAELRDLTPVAPVAPDAPDAPAVEKIKQMTDLASGVSYDDYIEAGWTDDTMIDRGHMVLVDPVSATPAVPAVPSVPMAPDAPVDVEDAPVDVEDEPVDVEVDVEDEPVESPVDAHKSLMTAINVALQAKTLLAGDLPTFCAHYGISVMQDFLTKAPQHIAEAQAHIVDGTLPSAK